MPRLIWVFAWRTVTLLVLSYRRSYSVEWAIKLIIITNQSWGLVDNSRDTERPFDCYWGWGAGGERGGGGERGVLYSGLEMLLFFFCDTILSFTKRAIVFTLVLEIFPSNIVSWNYFLVKISTSLIKVKWLLPSLAIWFKLASSCLFYFI